MSMWQPRQNCSGCHTDDVIVIDYQCIMFYTVVTELHEDKSYIPVAIRYQKSYIRYSSGVYLAESPNNHNRTSIEPQQNLRRSSLEPL